MSVNVKVGADGSVEPEDVDCKCDKSTWPIVIICLGFGNAFLVTLLCVLSLMQFSDVAISVYLIILSLLGLLAEFRRIKFLRSAIYQVIRYIYFLTNYYARGAYHIFIGTVLFSNVPLNIIAGCVSIAFGIMLIVIHTIIKLPNYRDWQVEKEEAEARGKSYVAGQTPLNSGGVTYTVNPEANQQYSPTDNHTWNASKPQNYDTTTNPYAANTATQSNPQSSASFNTATGSAKYVPSSSNTAYMAAQPQEDPYGEEPISAAPISRARMQDDKSLADAYYAPQPRGQKVTDPDDPFARDDNQYRPNHK